MACAICSVRRPRRFCPGVHADICTLCCGTQREVTVDCPLDCEYLREAHLHERAHRVEPEDLPNRDVPVSEEFLEGHQPLLASIASALGAAALRTPGIIDLDLREALDAAIRTQRTLQSGLVYESLPANPLAAQVCRALLQAVADFRNLEYEKLGLHQTRDSDILPILVFLQHFELTLNNRRPRSRAFLGTLLDYYPPAPGSEPPEPSSLILP